MAQDLRISNATVCKWRKRFLVRGLDGLVDEPRPGAPRRVSDGQVEAAIRYAVSWARGNAAVGSNGDPAFYERLVQNYLPRGLEQAREWLQQSRSRWTSDL